MTTAQYPNRDALQQGLNIYQSNMSQFIAHHLRQKPGSRLTDTITKSLPDRQAQEFADCLQKNGQKVEEAIEIGFIPPLIERNWTDIFQGQFGGQRTIRNTLQVIRDIRNTLAHDYTGNDFDLDKAETGLYLISEALANIKRPEQQQVLKIRDRIRQNSRQPSVSQPPLIPGSTPQNGNSTDLKPWREVIAPTTDVADGSFQESEFAANLQQVYDGSAVAVYGDPLEFFQRTYITTGTGIRNLLTTVVRRITENIGNPVIQTQTGFGGGKTHSLIAIYHLISSNDVLLNAPDTPQYSRIRGDIRAMLAESGVDPEKGFTARVAVLSGTWLSQNSNRKTDAGDPLNTLWGEMAWQLGGQDAYEKVGMAARKGRAPGGEDLDELFINVGPLRHPVG